MNNEEPQKLETISPGDIDEANEGLRIINPITQRTVGFLD